ncbi:MAG: HEAT repeat domain-containing protein, partial [Blastocatellia bacterium]|nr:HEAT repeat domain-containing protein [Blastocatellia bacterium]
VIYLSSDEAAQVLLPLLQDKSILVRKETVYALGKVQNQLAVQPLLRILQTDKELEVRMSATVALGEIGDIRAINELVKILQRKPTEKKIFCAVRRLAQSVKSFNSGKLVIIM